MKYKKIIIIAVIVAVVAFYGGMKYGQSGSTSSAGGRNATSSQFGGRGARGGAGGGAGLVTGQIISTTDNSVTISLKAGGSQLVFFSTSTSILNTASGTPSDLLVGKTIMANGSSNSDGSVNADSIQIRP